MTDEEIVKKIQQGQYLLYTEILKRYEKKIYYYIRRITSWDQLSIEDMTQDTFIKTYRNLQSFDTSKKFSSWIYRIGHNVAVDFLKSQKRPSVSLDGLEEVLVSKQLLVEDMAILESDKQKLAKMIEMLPVKYKEVIVLYYMEEKTYDEIGEILRIPISTVGVLLLRARQKLKQFYEKK